MIDSDSIYKKQQCKQQ